jgi:hypothetical protein
VAKGLARLDADAKVAAGKALRQELDRLDAMLRACWSKAIGGDMKAVDRVLKISERRSKLLGLDAPERVVYPDPPGTPTPRHSDAELAEKIVEVFAKADAKAQAAAKLLGQNGTLVR